ncbi:MAG: tRNA pseudouridine(54/55) synthase Pus10 [Candidatus Methanosuratincola sp.]|jgi:tRNA pseudouridine synthase 10|nr:tRNA pseudouridine(54/55) synthase Pus10 [Candidatus Methanosuratincola sp.]
MSLIEKARSMLLKYPLCDSCLGRQFGGLGRGITNRERGFALKLVITMEAHMGLKRGEGSEEEVLRALAAGGAHQPAANLVGAEAGDVCHICGGIMERIGEYAAEVVRALDGYEYRTFLIGVKVSGELAEREDALKSEFGIEFGESMKMETSREIGKLVSKATGREVEFSKPDVVVTVGIPGPVVEVSPMPLFVFGRYRKLARGIPQSKWDCVHCRGKGCEVCHGTGKIYPISVEEIVCGPILRAAGGKETKFHGAGREDVDAIMSGNGRPFVGEVREPKVRELDLRAVEAEINKGGNGMVEVVGLRLSDRRTVRRLKEGAKVAEKVYRALVELDRDIGEEEARALGKSFNGCVINQLTPNRVLHRRADRLRLKKVYEMSIKMIDPRHLELVVRCQGGLYVKELISGDGGRTTPSVSEILGCGARCTELDVIAVNEGV